MKAVCISNFNYYDIRIQYVRDYLMMHGYDVTYITGDYNTMNRESYQLDVAQTIQIPLIRYKKNISMERVYSHYKFSQAVYEQLKQLQPDVIYAMIPPNFMARFVARYKREHPHVKVYFDIFDMWPETFPSTQAKRWMKPVFNRWAKLRNDALQFADGLITECQLFLDYLQTQRLKLPAKTGVIYPCMKAVEFQIVYDSQPDQIGICYLGSINNIIDIDAIAHLLQEIGKQKKVVLHIIGDGERRQEMLEKAADVCEQVIYHGGVYDDRKKTSIFNQCAFGLNVLKSSVFIGLTMKSIDYFNSGLPLINTVIGDTARFITEYQVGIQLNEDNVAEVAERVAQLSDNDIMIMKTKSKALFQSHFNRSKYEPKLDNILEL